MQPCPLYDGEQHPASDIDLDPKDHGRISWYPITIQIIYKNVYSK